jgi:ATP-dependent DNA helicase RecG
VIREFSDYGLKEPLFEEIQGGLNVTIFNETTDSGVNEGVNELFKLIEQNPGKRTPFFEKELNTSIKNIERWLKQLKDESKIKFRGAPKTGGYFIKEK